MALAFSQMQQRSHWVCYDIYLRHYAYAKKVAKSSVILDASVLGANSNVPTSNLAWNVAPATYRKFYIDYL